MNRVQDQLNIDFKSLDFIWLSCGLYNLLVTRNSCFNSYMILFTHFITMKTTVRMENSYLNKVCNHTNRRTYILDLIHMTHWHIHTKKILTALWQLPATFFTKSWKLGMNRNE